METSRAIGRWSAGCVLAFGLAVGTAQAVEPGQLAPAVDLPGTSAPVSLSKLQGKVVYLDFWASWCGPCRQSFPWMNEMQAKYGPKGLQIVAVNVDSKREDADRFLASSPANFVVAYDSRGQTPSRYQIKGMPSSVLIGANGQVIRVHAGFRQEERKAQEDAIVAALGTLQ